MIDGLPNWRVMIYADVMQIGCETHSIEAWSKFKQVRIKLMDLNAAEWWKENKEAILLLANAHKLKHEAEKAKATPVEGRE